MQKIASVFFGPFTLDALLAGLAIPALVTPGPPRIGVDFF